MRARPVVLLTGSRGRVGRAVRSAMADQWDLKPYSREPGSTVLPLEHLLDGSQACSAAALLHAAWSTVPAVAEEQPDSTARHDLPLIDRIVKRLKGDPAPPLVIFMSTGAVYGPAPGRASREEDLPRPIGAYARGKLEAEEKLRASGLPVCILRVGNLYGLPSRPDDRQGVLARLVRAALTGGTVQRWGDDPVKDYLHSDDFFAALRLVVEHRLTGTWNLGSGSGTPLSLLIRLVERETGVTLRTEPRPAPPWDVADNRLDISRFQRAAGWVPRMPLAEGVAREVAQLRGALTPA